MPRITKARSVLLLDDTDTSTSVIESMKHEINTEDNKKQNPKRHLFKGKNFEIKTSDLDNSVPFHRYVTTNELIKWGAWFVGTLIVAIFFAFFFRVDLLFLAPMFFLALFLYKLSLPRKPKKHPVF